MVASQGDSEDEEPLFDESAWSVRQAYLAAPLSNIVRVCGEATATLWAAVLLKKKIVVCGDNVDNLLDFVRALPIFALHR